MRWIYKEKKIEWEKCFAWMPVSIGFPPQYGQLVIWLEWVERKWLGCTGTDVYEYRLIQKEK